MPRVEPVQPQARGGHGVEDRGLQVRVAVVARLLPAVVVAHEEDDVRAVGGPRRREPRGQQPRGTPGRAPRLPRYEVASCSWRESHRLPHYGRRIVDPTPAAARGCAARSREMRRRGTGCLGRVSYGPSSCHQPRNGRQPPTAPRRLEKCNPGADASDRRRRRGGLPSRRRPEHWLVRAGGRCRLWTCRIASPAFEAARSPSTWRWRSGGSTTRQRPRFGETAMHRPAAAALLRTADDTGAPGACRRRTPNNPSRRSLRGRGHSRRAAAGRPCRLRHRGGRTHPGLGGDDRADLPLGARVPPGRRRARHRAAGDAAAHPGRRRSTRPRSPAFPTSTPRRRWRG